MNTREFIRKKFVFLVATANQAFHSVEISKLFATNEVECSFITLDNIYGQSGASYLSERSISSLQINECGQVEDWCAMSRTERAPHLEKITQWAHSHLSDPEMAVLFVGYDVGDVEQILIRTAERYGIKTVRYQDGIQNLTRKKPDNPLEGPALYPAMPCEGGCDLYLLWSNALAQEFDEKGLGGLAVPVGSLKHDRLAVIPHYSSRRSENEIVVGLAGQPLADYGFAMPQHEIALYEHIMNAVLRRPENRIIFRPHPESKMANSFARVFEHYGERVRIEAKDSLETFLSKIDALVTITSTVAIDAASVGIPAYRLQYLLHETSLELFEVCDRRYSRAFQHTDFPFSQFEPLAKKSNNQVQAFLNTPDGKAKDRIQQAVSSLPKAPSRSADHAVTAIIDTDGIDPMPTIMSTYRNLGAHDRIFLVDRSSNLFTSRFLAEHPMFSWLEVIEAKGRNPGDALKEAVKKTNTPFLLRITAGTHLFPESFEKLLTSLSTSQPTTEAVSAWFFGRNECEAAEGVVEIPEHLSLENLQQFQSYQMTSYCYLTKTETFSQCDFVQSPNPDISFIQAQAKSQALSIHQAPLFATPIFHESNFALNLQHYQRRFPPQKETVLVASTDSAERILDLMRTGDYSAALSILEHHYPDTTKTPTEVLYMRAVLLAKKEKLDESIHSLEVLLSREPDHQEAKTLLSGLRM